MSKFFNKFIFYFITLLRLHISPIVLTNPQNKGKCIADYTQLIYTLLKTKTHNVHNLGPASRYGHTSWYAPFFSLDNPFKILQTSQVLSNKATHIHLHNHDCDKNNKHYKIGHFKHLHSNKLVKIKMKKA